MLFFLGRRYSPVLVLIGAVLLVIGIALHGILLMVAGAIVLVRGVVSSLAAWRNRGLIGGKGDSGSLR